MPIGNHLGNVLTTVSDRKIGVYSNGSLTLPNDSVVAVVDYYEPLMVNATDYYAFGMPSRVASSATGAGYRFGFNGKENDNEVKGFGNQQDYGMRIYDPRIGRFLSVDPLTAKYPWYTPYSFAGNKPIVFIDIDGAEEAEISKKYLPFSQDMANTPTSYKGVSGRTVKTTYNLHGFGVNYLYFWEKLITASPDFLDEWNKGRVLEEGRAPIFTNQLKGNFEKLGIPTAGLKVGDILEHHHINQGRTAIPITSSEHDQIPTQKSGVGSAIRNKFGQVGKAASNVAKKASGFLGFWGGIVTEVIGIFNGNPDAWINQFGGYNKKGELYKQPESGLYYNIVSLTMNENQATGFFWIYEKSEWDKEQRKFVGVNAVGYGEAYQEKTGYSWLIVYDLEGNVKSQVTKNPELKMNNEYY